MRVFNRRDFMKLPAGTAFCKGKRWCFDSITFKGETLFGRDGEAIDWLETNPAWVDGKDSGECFDRLEEMLAAGVSYPMQDSDCRDGRFNDDDIFLVFDRVDLLTLRNLVDVAISVS